MRLIRQLLGAAGVTLGLAACGQGGSLAERDATPERIILVVVDTLRADHLSPYSAKVSTPNIQAFAERGQVFTNVVSSFHQTTMSMASLFTGRTPSLESGHSQKTLDWTGRNWCGMRRFAPEISRCPSPSTAASTCWRRYRCCMAIASASGRRPASRRWRRFCPSFLSDTPDVFGLR